MSGSAASPSPSAVPTQYVMSSPFSAVSEFAWPGTKLKATSKMAKLTPTATAAPSLLVVVSVAKKPASILA